MSWPNPADYQEALQYPQACFVDPELKGGMPLTDQWGLPRPVSGAFATVYRVDFQGQKHAVRCFLRYISDIEMRYALISDYLQKVRLPFMVEFKFLSQGIRVRGQWYPILKMDWVEGDRLDTYIGKNLNNPQALADLALKFLKLTHDLKRASIAHGDLQHGNILVVNGELRLIDYDGMYVPGLAGCKSNELGQPNYQHPRRSEKDFGLYLDHFSEWVIYLSLVALAVDPGLRNRYAPGNEYLLIRRDDYLHPDSSQLLKTLERTRDGTVQAMAARLTSFLYSSNLVQIPSLDPRLVPTRESVQAAAKVPGWLVDYLPVPERPAPATVPKLAPQVESVSPGDTWVHDFVQSAPASPPASISGTNLFERVLLALGAPCLLLLALAAFLGFAETMVAAGMMGLVACIMAAGLALRFNLLPDIRKKNALRARHKNVQLEIAWGEKRLENLNESVKRLEVQEKQLLEHIATRRRESVQKEIDQVKAAHQELQSRLSQINARRQQLAQSESDEKKRALESLQNQALADKLSEHHISSANLPGIGKSVWQNLRDQGIFTAAEVGNVQIVPAPPGFHDPAVYILVPGRGPVRVEELSPGKAQVLLAWRRGLEKRLRPHLPQSIPFTQQTWIQVKYRTQHRFLAPQEEKATQRAKEAEQSVHAKWEKQRQLLSEELQKVPGEYESARQQLFQEMVEKKKHVSDKKWERARLERELEPYCALTFWAYLKHIF